MRTLPKTEAFEAFYCSLPQAVQQKMDYALTVLSQIKVVNQKFVKKLRNSDFYELRLSVELEYRILLYPIDHENVIEATEVLLMNGFIKKSNKDYKPAIKEAETILKNLSV